MKRPILGFLAAVLLSFGLSGFAPAGAATSATAAHKSGGDHDGYKYSHPRGDGSAHRRHPRHGDGDHDDHDDHDGRDRHGRKRCAGLIVICLG